MMLSDGDIEEALEREDLIISPLAEGAIQPASIDLRLGDCLALPHREDLDGGLPVRNRKLWLDPGRETWLEPGQFVLASTYEYVTVGANLALKLEGKSSLGRLGLVIHATAGFIDPGFEGEITLELSNVGENMIGLTPGMFIAQVCVFELKTPARKPYGHPDRSSRYQGQRGPTPSRF